MPEDGPTLGEVVRRLEDVMRQLATVAQQLADMPKQLDSTYVRKETYTVQLRADQTISADLRHDLDAIVDQQRTTRRIVWSTAAAPVLVALLTLILSNLYR